MLFLASLLRLPLAKLIFRNKLCFAKSRCEPCVCEDGTSYWIHSPELAIDVKLVPLMLLCYFLSSHVK